MDEPAGDHMSGKNDEEGVFKIRSTTPCYEGSCIIKAIRMPGKGRRKILRTVLI
jgi:hypothetical protein